MPFPQVEIDARREQSAEQSVHHDDTEVIRVRARDSYMPETSSACAASSLATISTARLRRVWVDAGRSSRCAFPFPLAQCSVETSFYRFLGARCPQRLLQSPHRVYTAI